MHILSTNPHQLSTFLPRIVKISLFSPFKFLLFFLYNHFIISLFRRVSMHSYYDLLISLGAQITNKSCRYIAEAILLLQKTKISA